MIHTRTAIEYRDGVGAVLPAIAEVDQLVDKAGDRQARLAAERALDEVLADSFPASDPPSWNPGIIRPYLADGFASDAVPADDAHRQRTFLQPLVSLLGAAGIALLLGVTILLVGLPIALVVRAVLEAIGRLFGITVR